MSQITVILDAQLRKVGAPVFDVQRRQEFTVADGIEPDWGYLLRWTIEIALEHPDVAKWGFTEDNVFVSKVDFI